MVFFTLTGLFNTIAFAIFTSWVFSTIQRMVATACQQMKGVVNSAQMPSLLTTCAASDLKTTAPMQNGISTKGSESINFVLTTPSESAHSTPSGPCNVSHDHLTVPASDEAESTASMPATPVLKPQTGGDTCPPLSLDDSETNPPKLARASTSLVTRSPYAQNESLKFAAGTPLWQSNQSSATSEAEYSALTRISPSLVTENPYTQNEGLKFAVGTPLWQSDNASTAPKQAVSTSTIKSPTSLATCSSSKQDSKPLTTRPGVILPASNMITESPFTANERVRFSADTSMWQPGNTANDRSRSSADTATWQPSDAGSMRTRMPKGVGRTCLITESPFTANEKLCFVKGTELWQPKA